MSTSAAASASRSAVTRRIVGEATTSSAPSWQLGQRSGSPRADDPAGAQPLGYLDRHRSGVAGGPEDQHRLARLEGDPAAQSHPG